VAVDGDSVECIWLGEEGDLFRETIPAIALEPTYEADAADEPEAEPVATIVESIGDDEEEDEDFDDEEEDDEDEDDEDDEEEDDDEDEDDRDEEDDEEAHRTEEEAERDEGRPEPAPTGRRKRPVPANQAQAVGFIALLLRESLPRHR